MQFNDTSNPNPVSSRNAADITLTGISTSTVKITVACGSHTYEFSAQPYQGSLVIRLSDILRSLRPEPFASGPSSDAEEAAATVTISASAEGQTSPTPWSRTVYDGGHKASVYDNLMSSYFWTWRAQNTRTFRAGKEFLGALFTSGSTAVKATVRFTDGTSQQSTLCTVNASTVKKFAIVDVSYERVAALYPTKTVVSYTIYRGTSQYGQTYTVSDMPAYRTLMFRNSLGLFDTVYAGGHVSVGAERDIRTFIGSDRKEGMTDNDTRERMTVNSGLLNTASEKALWNELVRSRQVFEYADGQLMPVIIDEFDMKLTERSSAAMTVKYHYSSAPFEGETKSAV